MAVGSRGLHMAAESGTCIWLQGGGFEVALAHGCNATDGKDDDQSASKWLLGSVDSQMAVV